MSNFIRYRVGQGETSLDDFALAARQFCDWAECKSSAGTARSEMLVARRHLSSLLVMAVNLPQFECAWRDSTLTHDDWTETFERFGVLPVGYYGGVCDPLEVPAGDTALGDLADDLADIWRDLKEGLLLFDKGERNAGGFSWQDSFDTHWGQHAADALAVIQFWLTQNRGQD